MLRFNKGDRVRLVRPSKSVNWYGINSSVGKKCLEFTVDWAKTDLRSSGADYGISGNGFNYVVYDDMLDPTRPPTPFEASVREYIQSELAP